MIRLMMFAIHAMLAFAGLCVIYVIAPILIPFIVVIGGLALLVFAIVTGSKALERRVHGEIRPPIDTPD